MARVRRVLAEEDEAQLKALDPREMQGWCDSRIAEYESRICALRSARNDAAPIHRFLPPELLLEIFANLLPTQTRRRHGLPVLRVCRRWRTLVLDTPQFWVNLIGQPLDATPGSRFRLELARLKFAIARSAALKLTLSWRGCNATAVDLFLPYTHRISSFIATFSNQDNVYLSRFIESEYPFLEHLSLTYNYPAFGPIAVCVSRFPRLRALQLIRSPILIPTTQCVLQELDLLQVSFRDTSDPHTARHDVGPILDLLNSTKCLETLCITDSLPEGIRGTSLSASRRTVRLPLLRTLAVRDDPRLIRVFFAYLEFPSTTTLSVEIQTQRADGSTIVMPFPSSLNTIPADDADVSLVLKLDSSAMAHWETYVNGSQTLRLTVFRDWESRADACLMDYTREVMALFAPPRLITSLFISGSQLGPEDRVALLADLPHLTRLGFTGPDGRLDGEVLPMLAESGPEGELLCASLEHLSFSWLHTSDRLAWVQDRLRAQRLPRPSPSADVRLPSPSNTVGTAFHLHGQRGMDDPKNWKPYSAAASHAFCQTVAAFLARRAAHSGRPLRTLGVSIRRPRSDYVHHHRWDVPSVRARLEEGLGHLVGSISVEYEENASPSGR
ncbi:hypothetical protein V8D89_002564 [Ganoderma adspersum]